MINQIKLWISKAVPAPTVKNKNVQVGCHVEEFAEMLEALGMLEEAAAMDRLGNQLKNGERQLPPGYDRKGLLDALADQVVTATGVAHMFNLDLVGACEEVNKSNWSKFVDGEPVFNAQGKIAKGPNYVPPDLTRFV
jgi:predicted HAD superfamily Cof-like phosphohydrolase